MTTKHTTPTARLMAAQTEIQAISKDKVNPHFRNKYADINTMLAEVKPALHKHGLLIVQPIEDGQVITRIIDAESGAVLCESALHLTGQGNPQQRGSEITYYRRYTLQSLLALEAEDDDANAASAPNPPAQANPADDKPWLNEDNPRYLKCLEVVDGQGEAVAIQAINQLKREFKINHKLQANIKFQAQGESRLLK